jgi:hypothetical protein
MGVVDKDCVLVLCVLVLCVLVLWTESTVGHQICDGFARCAGQEVPAHGRAG